MAWGKRSFKKCSDGLKFHLPSAGKTMTDDELSQYRGTKNQDLGRKINNRIRRHAGPWQGNKICVVCECVDCDCEELIQVTVEQYQQIRKDDSVFLVVVGHQSPSVERIVGGEGKWLAIQKTGQGKRYAEELDTPSPDGYFKPFVVGDPKAALLQVHQRPLRNPS